MTIIRRRWLAAWLIGAWIVLPGCGQSTQKAVYPVKGQVFVKSQPADGALVIFRPAGDPKTEEWPAGFPRATVAADGSFEVSTYGTADGAPAGDYTVQVQWRTAAEGADPEAATVDRLGGRYMDAAKPKLRAKVEEKPTELPKFDLQ